MKRKLLSFQVLLLVEIDEIGKKFKSVDKIKSDDANNSKIDESIIYGYEF